VRLLLSHDRLWFVSLSFSHQLRDNVMALHEYTHAQKKKAARGEGYGFDGELDNFQQPELSSLVKLVSSSSYMFSFYTLLMTLDAEYG
jgi:hypothetical protein